MAGPTTAELQDVIERIGGIFAACDDDGDGLASAQVLVASCNIDPVVARFWGGSCADLERVLPAGASPVSWESFLARHRERALMDGEAAPPAQRRPPEIERSGSFVIKPGGSASAVDSFCSSVIELPVPGQEGLLTPRMSPFTQPPGGKGGADLKTAGAWRPAVPPELMQQAPVATTTSRPGSAVVRSYTAAPSWQRYQLAQPAASRQMSQPVSQPVSQPDVRQHVVAGSALQHLRGPGAAPPSPPPAPASPPSVPQPAAQAHAPVVVAVSEAGADSSDEEGDLRRDRVQMFRSWARNLRDLADDAVDFAEDLLEGAGELFVSSRRTEDDWSPPPAPAPPAVGESLQRCFSAPTYVGAGPGAAAPYGAYLGCMSPCGSAMCAPMQDHGQALAAMQHPPSPTGQQFACYAPLQSYAVSPPPSGYYGVPPTAAPPQSFYCASPPVAPPTQQLAFCGAASMTPLASQQQMGLYGSMTPPSQPRRSSAVFSPTQAAVSPGSYGSPMRFGGASPVAPWGPAFGVSAH